jgi:uncharacterized protein (DUF433 family)
MTSVREVQFSVSEAAFITSLSQAEVQKAVDEGWFATAQRRVLQGRPRRSFCPADLVHLRLVKDVGDWAVLHTDAKRQIHQRLWERLPDVVFARGDQLVIVEAKEYQRFSPQALTEQLDRYWRQLDATEPPADITEPQVKSLTLSEHSVVRFILTHPDKDHMAGLQFWARSVANRLEEPIRISHATLEIGATWQEIVDRTTEIISAQWAVVSDPEIRGGEPVVRGTRIPAHLLYDLSQQGASTEELLKDYPALDERSLKSALLYARTHPRRGRPRKGHWHERRRNE